MLRGRWHGVPRKFETIISDRRPATEELSDIVRGMLITYIR